MLGKISLTLSLSLSLSLSLCVCVCARARARADWAASAQNALAMPGDQLAATPQSAVLPATVVMSVPTDGTPGHIIPMYHFLCILARRTNIKTAED